MTDLVQPTGPGRTREDARVDGEGPEGITVLQSLKDGAELGNNQRNHKLGKNKL